MGLYTVVTGYPPTDFKRTKVFTMTDENTATNTATNLLVTSKQFLGFETISIAIFSLFVMVCGYIWHGHADEFKELKQDVKTISQVIPTLATKDEMNAKLDAMDKKMDRRFAEMTAKTDAKFAEMKATNNEKFDKIDLKFEKVDEKLDALIASVNNIQATLTTQVTINSYRLDQIEKNHSQPNKVENVDSE
ncbi:MAG: DNA anti-recombination protein RmuC [Phenylobacterium sp.]|jgi:DNA anti-recombination protein RmuC